MAKAFPKSKEDAALFKDVVFIVEATSCEYMSLWREYHYSSRPGLDDNGLPLILSWEEVGMGHAITIGEVDKRPNVISIRYAILNGKRVMFYYGCSQVVDHQMIRNWLEMHASHLTYDNGHRWAHTNATNFGHCYQVIK